MLECKVNNGKSISIYAVSEQERHLYFSTTLVECHKLKAQTANQNVVTVDLYRDGVKTREMQLIFRSVQTDEDENGSSGQVAFFVVNDKDL